VDLVTVEEHATPVRLQQPGERAQQGGLAARVGADDRGDHAVGDVDRQAVGDHALVVGEPEVGAAEARPVGGVHMAPVRISRVNNQRRYGAPITAVAMPDRQLGRGHDAPGGEIGRHRQERTDQRGRHEREAGRADEPPGDRR
jgi:hypothetical protein